MYRVTKSSMIAATLALASCLGAGGVMAATASANGIPPAVRIGGGWEYQSNEPSGSCGGDDALVANDNGGGSITIEAETVSALGPITSGTGVIVWQETSNGSGKGSRSYSMSASDSNWLSGMFNINAKVGADITIQFIGNFDYPGGSCTIGDPSFTFDVS
jgi:hypothetical protein